MNANLRLILSVTGLVLLGQGLVGCEYYKGEALTAGHSTAEKSAVEEPVQMEGSGDLEEEKAAMKQVVAEQMKMAEEGSAAERAAAQKTIDALNQKLADLEDQIQKAKEPTVVEAPAPTTPPTPVAKSEPTPTEPSKTPPATPPAAKGVIQLIGLPPSDTESVASTPVVRYRNSETGGYLYTTAPENEAAAEYTKEGAFTAAFTDDTLPNTVPVYRFSNGTDHFYSTNNAEPISGYTGEGIAFYAYSSGSLPPSSVKTTPVFRLYNQKEGIHFYTESVDEKATAIAQGYIWEGIAWYAPSQEAFANNPVSIFRYASMDYKDYFYTQVIQEGVGRAYQSEGVAFKAYHAPKSASSVAIYRFKNDSGNRHFYTADYNEGANAGLIGEGVAFYADAKESADTVPVYRFYNSETHLYTVTHSEGTVAGYGLENILCYVPR